jgi:hypothetical protein
LLGSQWTIRCLGPNNRFAWSQSCEQSFVNMAPAYIFHIGPPPTKKQQMWYSLHIIGFMLWMIIGNGHGDRCTIPATTLYPYTCY